MKLSILSLTFALFSTACSPWELQYKRAEEVDGWNGYYDEEISSGVYFLEIQKIGGFSYVNDLNPKLMQHYDRRAKELCPAGYTKKVKVIKPYQAHFDTFRCPLNFCQNYPMLSGVVTCNNITSHSRATKNGSRPTVRPLGTIQTK